MASWLRQIQSVADAHRSGPDDRRVHPGAVLVEPHGRLQEARVGNRSVGMDIEHPAADIARADRDRWRILIIADAEHASDPAIFGKALAVRRLDEEIRTKAAHVR